jgi:hypothetical protein
MLVLKTISGITCRTGDIEVVVQARSPVLYALKFPEAWLKITPVAFRA